MVIDRCPICKNGVSKSTNFISLTGEGPILVHLTCFFEDVPKTKTDEEHTLAVNRRAVEIITMAEQK